MKKALHGKLICMSHFLLTECNRWMLASLKFLFALMLAVALLLLCDVSYVTINEKFS